MVEDIEGILEYTALMAKGYDNHMKWNEEAKLKSDMMRRMDRWRKVTTDEIRAKCEELGMRHEDVNTVCDMHARRLQGRRLVPQHSYRGFEFRHDA
ncbi:hypothetical protein [uncultured Olegusella sp.]|uniref:hypothetical protein n=1 Tax=uncultured Olegusella sp. TaxID=1979846 RepID=UPI00262D832C|nr:hypothetical protein [uncultured Olegusella sp.]